MIVGEYTLTYKKPLGGTTGQQAESFQSAGSKSRNFGVQSQLALKFQDLQLNCLTKGFRCAFTPHISSDD